jgi:CubicO group peptidase (beta-lactamase class C family)
MLTVSPAEVGFSAARLNKIGETMQRLVDQGLLAGMTTMIARRGLVFHYECHGMMDLESGKTMQPDAIFRIYSMTKPITSVAVMMLYEEGLFQLDDPVTKFIPEFNRLRVLSSVSDSGAELTELDREITIRHLLTHTSGLGYGLFEDSPIEDMIRASNLVDPILVLRNSLEETIRSVVEIPLAHQPGTGWRYSLATDVLGYLISVISDIPFDLYLEQKVFKPLGMNDTAFYVPSEKIERFTAMYGMGLEGDFMLFDAPETSPFLNPDYHPSGGAGLLSTTADYYRFAQMLLNGGELDGVRLIGPKTIELMTANHLPDDLIPIRLGPTPVPGHGFGLGVRVLVDPAQFGVLGSAGEYGWGGAASTYFWIDPKEELIGILMPQFLPASLLPVPLREIFKNLTYQALVD